MGTEDAGNRHAALPQAAEHVRQMVRDPRELGHRDRLAAAHIGLLVPLHDWIALNVSPTTLSRMTVLVTFALILLLMTATRFASFKVIQQLHQRGIGNRNVLMIVVEALGQFADPWRQSILMQPFGDPALTRRYAVSTGTTTY